MEKKEPKVNEETRKRLSRMQNRFRKALEAVQPQHSMWSELDKFDRGKQWDDLPVPPWVPKPVANYIRYIRTLKRANLTGNIPHAVFSPEYPEDVQLIDKLQRAYNYIWDRKKLPRVVRRAVDRALLFGTSVAYVYEDDNFTGGKYYGSIDVEAPDYNPQAVNNSLFRGEICADLLSITNFFPDPDAYRIQDCKFIETTQLMSLNTVKNNPKFRKYIEEQGNSVGMIAGHLLDKDQGSNGDVFQRQSLPTNTVNTLDGDDMVTVHTHWERYLHYDEETGSSSWRLDATWYIKEVPFELLRLEDMKPNCYPFEVLYDEEEDQEFWGTSTAMDILSLQKVINKTAQTSSIIATLHQNPQKIVTRESGINAQEMARTGTLPGKVWVSNVPGEQAVHVIKPADIPRGLFETEDRMKADIREMAGINEAYTGESVGSLTTSTGVQDLIERATQRDRDKMVQIDQFVEGLSDIIVQFILHKWDTERSFTQRQPDGTIAADQWQPVDELTINNLDWRVKSDVYATAPTTEQAKRQQIKDLLVIQGQHQFQPAIVTPEELIKQLNYDNSQETLARMAKDRQVMQQQAMQEAQNAPIPPLGEFNISLSSKDPNTIYTYLEQAKQQGIDLAMLNVQTQAQLDKAHGLYNQVAEKAGESSVNQGQTGNGSATSPAAQANMNRG